MTRWHALIRLAAVFLAVCGPAWGAEPTAVATLTRREIVLGEDVDLEVRVQGGSQLRWQGALQVEGLEIAGPRMESQLAFGNLFGGGGSGITLSFSITPQRAGEFMIPSISLSVDGRAVRTEPVALKVFPDGNGVTQKRADQPTLGLLDLVLPPGPLYVGQLIPVELHLSGAANIRWGPEAMPELRGDGFTKLRFPEPKQQRGERNGETLDVYVFRTAITPSKAGRLTLGPIEVPYAAVIPRARPRRQRSFFDDIFSDPAFGVTQHFKAQAAAHDLEVQPLPAAGRPESFSGGIGDFKFTAEGGPARVKAGDPVTMKLTVTGTGNFDRLDAPTLKTPQGWRAYPPSSEFVAGDDLGISGTKTFTVAVIPETQQTSLPIFEFSYFDPRTGKYQTLQSGRQPLVVEGGAPPAPPAPVVVAPAADQPVPMAGVAPAERDIHGLRYDGGRPHRTFAPLYRQTAFWVAQAVPALALLGWAWSKRRRPTELELRRREWTRERAALLVRLRGEAKDGFDFIENAAQFIRLETALRTGREPSSIDAPTALAVWAADPETAAAIERVFDARAAALYAGPGLGSSASDLAPEERRDLVAKLQQLTPRRARA